MKKIGVICSSIFHIIHTRHIVNELVKRDIEVVYINFSPNLVGDTSTKLLRYFEELEVNNCDFIDFFSNQRDFDAILAHHFFPGLQLIDPYIKKIRVLYGYAKDGWNYAEWNKVFDVVLTYGPYAEKRLSHMTSVVNIGHPRLQKTYDRVLIDSNGKQLVLTKSKPVLVYCPTWSELSSFDLFSENLKILEGEYVVLVKMHHNNLLSKNNITTEMKDVYFFDDYTDLFDLLNISDVVLSDYSGAIFDAMLFRKPIVLFDIVDEEVKDTGIVSISKMTNIMEDTSDISNESSLDITVRSYLKHSRIFENVMILLKQALEKSEVSYDELLPTLYSFEDDLAPRRGANAIIELINQIEKKSQSIYKVIDIEMVQTFFEKNPNENIAIWGAGELGQIFYAWLKSNNYRIDCFFDMDSSKIGKEIDGIRIFKPLSSYKVIIAVTNYKDKIAQILATQGNRELDDFIYPF